MKKFHDFVHDQTLIDMTDSKIYEQLLHSIGAVERATGLGKDTLRAWERRYQFPKPLRDSNDERVYPLDQVTSCAC